MGAAHVGGDERAELCQRGVGGRFRGCAVEDVLLSIPGGQGL